MVHTVYLDLLVVQSSYDMFSSAGMLFSTVYGDAQRVLRYGSVASGSFYAEEVAPLLSVSNPSKQITGEKTL